MGVEQVNRGSYIIAHVLSNLLSKLRISDKLRVLLAFYGFCATNLINSIIQELNVTFYISLRLLRNLISGVKKLRFCHNVRIDVLDVILLITLTKAVNHYRNQTLKEPSREKALLTLRVMTEMHFLLQKNLKNIMHGCIKMYAMR